MARVFPWPAKLAAFLLVVVMAALGWGLFRTAHWVGEHLERLAESSPSRTDDLAYSLLIAAYRAALVPLLAFYGVETLPGLAERMPWTEKIPAIAAILSTSWLLAHAACFIERAVLGKKEAFLSIKKRGLATRVRLLRRIGGMLLGVMTLAALLMLFDSLRHLGTSLLASAGIAGVVLGLAAQQAVGNLFAGIQMAFSQPIRIGDQVNVNGETGIVEEITLTFVVVRLWDMRRLMLPISYLIENPFQNWTRMSSNLTSAVVLSVDYTTPVARLRQKFEEVLKASLHWNSAGSAVHVVGSNEVSMQVRFTAGANSAGESFELQCEIREKMLDFLRRELPNCLPRARNEQKAVEDWNRAVNDAGV
jgi:small-conductance mechanosensitive channel